MRGDGGEEGKRVPTKFFLEEETFSLFARAQMPEKTFIPFAEARMSEEETFSLVAKAMGNNEQTCATGRCSAGVCGLADAKLKLFYRGAADFGFGVGGDGINGDLGGGGSSGDFVEVALGNHLAVAVKVCTEFDNQPADAEVSANGATFLEGKGILYEEITCHLSPEIHVLADDIAADDGFVAYDYATLGNDFTIKNTIDTDVIGRIDFAFDGGSGRDSANLVNVY